MKTPALIKKAKAILTDSMDKDRCQKSYLKDIQKKLKKKENKLKAKLSSEKDKKKIKEIEQELAVLKVQRKKVLSVLKGC